MEDLLEEFIEWAKDCGEDAWYIFENTDEAIRRFKEQRNKVDAILINHEPATPVGMCCEKVNCKNINGKDYKRKKEDEEVGWEGEPIFLCSEHSNGYELFVDSE